MVKNQPAKDYKTIGLIDYKTRGLNYGFRS